MSNVMEQAFAGAKPTVQSHVRRVSYNGDKTLTVYFKDDRLVGRYFRISGIENALITIEETSPPSGKKHHHGQREGSFGSIIRYVGAKDGKTNTIGTSLTTPQYAFNQAFKLNRLNIAPNWAHGKLGYLIEVPAEYVGNRTVPGDLGNFPAVLQEQEKNLEAMKRTAAERTTNPRIGSSLDEFLAIDAYTEEVKRNTPTLATKLHQLLEDIRSVEKDTPYQLERAADGSLRFVSSID